jgi:hypothetical protein
MPMRTGSIAGDNIGVRDVEENESAREVFLRALSFDDQGMSQGGAGLSTENLARIQCLRGGVASDAWLLVKVASLGFRRVDS